MDWNTEIRRKNVREMNFYENCFLSRETVQVRQSLWETSGIKCEVVPDLVYHSQFKLKP